MTWNKLKKQVRNNGGFTLLDIGQAVVNAVDELDARVKALEQAKGTGSTIRGCMFPLDGFPPKVKR